MGTTPPSEPRDDLDDLLRLADERLAAARNLAWVGNPLAPTLLSQGERFMFVAKFDFPEHFGARVTAIHEHVRDTQASQTTVARREALTRALIDSCELLGDINIGALSYELTEMIDREMPLSQVSLIPIEMEKLLHAERQLLREVGVSETAINSIDNLCRQIHRLRESKVSPQDIVQDLLELQTLICAQSDQAIAKTEKSLRAPGIWSGVAGTTVLLVNAGAMSLGVAQAALSSALGGALISRALGKR